jgi:rhomboid protease GluP
METIVLRLSGSERAAREWALVLTAAGISSAVRGQGTQWALVVAAGAAAQAAAALDAYDRENLERPTPAAASGEYGATWAGYVVAGLLVAFYAALALGADSERWYAQGAAVARRILDGELWRTVTALTLHAGVGHVAANAVACVVFVTAVCRVLGPGVGLWLTLLSGALGNGLNALLRGAPHSAVGASTAVFGAVGILGALQFTKRARFGPAGRRAWIPLAAALGLLAMLGTGRESDVLAHLFGFLAGIVLGSGAGRSLAHLPSPALQMALALGAVAAVMVCWAIALSQ